jgi:hypothetical protein
MLGSWDISMWLSLKASPNAGYGYLSLFDGVLIVPMTIRQQAGNHISKSKTRKNQDHPSLVEHAKQADP